MTGAVAVESLRDGRVLRLTLARPKANVLDAAMIAALRAALPEDPSPHLRLLVIDHEGPHFSFGASVEEHLPAKVGEMLRGFHDLLRALEGVGVPTVAVVRGQCLGGGLELALACGRIVADPTAKLGLPEIKLGVFPPAGSVLLPLRVGVPRATALVVTGATVDATEAFRLGLVDEIADDPRAACLAWFDEHLGQHSAVALRQAWRAVRHAERRALADELHRAERQYLDELMARRDPVEGLNAFLARRAPVWEDA